ncbi:MAG: zf-HC2 domain-containing protein [Planctomycetes bacterium]|nr:zf-HC2 domain-containing protein [Planctomycetota bacterium]
MNCHDVRENLSAYLDGELPASGEGSLSGVAHSRSGSREDVDRHLESCSDCRAELASLERTVELVRSLPRSAFPAELAEEIRSAVGRARAGAGAGPKGRVFRLPAVWFAGASALAAALLLVVTLRLGGGAETAGTQPPEDLAQSPTDAAPRAPATLEKDSDGERAKSLGIVDGSTSGFAGEVSGESTPPSLRPFLAYAEDPASGEGIPETADKAGKDASRDEVAKEGWREGEKFDEPFGRFALRGGLDRGGEDENGEQRGFFSEGDGEYERLEKELEDGERLALAEGAARRGREGRLDLEETPEKAIPGPGRSAPRAPEESRKSGFGAGLENPDPQASQGGEGTGASGARHEPSADGAVPAPGNAGDLEDAEKKKEEEAEEIERLRDLKEPDPVPGDPSSRPSGGGSSAGPGGDAGRDWKAFQKGADQPAGGEEGGRGGGQEAGASQDDRDEARPDDADRFAPQEEAPALKRVLDEAAEAFREAEGKLRDMIEEERKEEQRRLALGESHGDAPGSAGGGDRIPPASEAPSGGATPEQAAEPARPALPVATVRVRCASPREAYGELFTHLEGRRFAVACESDDRWTVTIDLTPDAAQALAARIEQIFPGRTDSAEALAKASEVRRGLASAAGEGEDETPDGGAPAPGTAPEERTEEGAPAMGSGSGAGTKETTVAPGLRLVVELVRE